VLKGFIGAFIIVSFKQFVIRVALHFLKGLILIKRHSGPVFLFLFSPVLLVWRFLIRVFGVPLYRLIFFVRRQLSRFLLPAKNKTVYFISNKYAIHAVIIFVAVGTSVLNFGATDVRAETFGQDSMLYQIVAQDEFQLVEIVEAQPNRIVQSSSYMWDTVVDANAHVDFNYIGQEWVTPVVGGDALSAPVIQEGSEEINSDATPANKREETTTYVVQEGDVLGAIAERFNLSLSTILWANDLTFRSVIQLGQELKIPPIDGVTYAVRSGDNLSSISRSYGVDVETILAHNDLSSSQVLSIGQELMLPGGEPPSSSGSYTAPVSSLFSSPPSSSASSRGSAYGSGTWVWPHDWRVITQYYGWGHTGLDVDGDYSTSSLASADGTVIFSGWRNGYGVTVEIDHGNGWMTRYAHHAKNYVSVGDVVYGGEPIGQTGTTGRSTGTHLHFEIIKDGRFLNPLDYIR
jgi:murein DD-endopeptidase MepM/ murein hydrolase activator NlpD